MKRFLALLLTLALLTGAACAEPLRPRREAAPLSEAAEEAPDPAKDAPLPGEAPGTEAPETEDSKEEAPKAEEAPETPDAPDGLRPRRDGAAHEAHHEARHDARWSDLPGEEALQDAETIEGSFTIDENGVKTVYDLTLTLGVVYPETSVGDGEALELAADDFGTTSFDQFYALELTAVPASGAGAALTARVEMAQGLGWKLPMLLEGRMTEQTPSELLSGTLTLHDASSGETFSHDTFSLQSDGLLTLRDELYGSTFETSIVPVRLNADLAALLGDAYAPLLSRLEELQEGETLTLGLLECALPLAQALYRPAADDLVETLGLDRGSIARDLLYLSGTIALTPTRNGLRITLLTDSDPRSYHYKFELDVDENGLHGDVYESEDGGYVSVGRVEVDATDGLYVFLEDYSSDGYLSFDAHEGYGASDEWSVALYGFSAALSYDLDGYGDSTHLLLNYNVSDVGSGSTVIEHEASLRLVDDGGVTTWTLNFLKPMSPEGNGE